jgi:SAM-dependent methyltransferase
MFCTSGHQERPYPNNTYEPRLFLKCSLNDMVSIRNKEVAIVFIGDGRTNEMNTAAIEEKVTPSRAEQDRLELILGGHVFFQTLRSAVDLDLFTILSSSPGITLDKIAAFAGVEVKPMRVLLLGCTSLGLVTKQGDLYYNTPTAEAFLNKNSASNMIPAIEFSHHLVYRPMFHMASAIREGRNTGLTEFPGKGSTLYERLREQPELERIFQNGLQSSSAANTAQLLANFDFGGTRHVLDVGGGKGTALCILAEKFPHIKGTVFESPTVCALATEYIASSGLAPRLTAQPGDAFNDTLPTGADCILFMHFMTIWSEQSNVELLKKSFTALPRGGHVIVFDGMQSNDRTGPIRAARWSPYFMVLSSGEGMFYTPFEYEDWMRQAGFVNVRSVQTAPDHVVVIGRRP